MNRPEKYTITLADLPKSPRTMHVNTGRVAFDAEKGKDKTVSLTPEEAEGLGRDGRLVIEKAQPAAVAVTPKKAPPRAEQPTASSDKPAATDKKTRPKKGDRNA